jgi:hydroxypyruvate isomerase
VTFTLAVCAEMVHLDLPIVDRAARLHDAGFAVEIWDWTSKDLDALAATGARFTSMTGYVQGELIDPGGADELLRTARQSVDAAHRLAGAAAPPHLNLHGTGLDGSGLPVRPVATTTGPMWVAAVDTLRRIAELGAEHDVVFTLENLNTALDHPGTPFGSAAETLALVRAVDSKHLRLNLDLYHAQIGEGNLIELTRRSLPWVGEIQVADVPGRCEPGSGEIHYPAVARALTDAGYRGVVALEGWASTAGGAGADVGVASSDGATPDSASDRALERFRSAFTVR